MKVTKTVIIEKEVQLKTLKVKANVRYWEDSEVNKTEDTNGELIPCREGDCWCPVIDIDTGIITNWEKGMIANIHYKVCDRCSYEVIDSEGNVVEEDENYVPRTLCPKENGYGDYIIMDIDENGLIKDWKFRFSDFTNED